MTNQHTWKIEKRIVACVRRYRIATEDVLRKSLSGDVALALRRLIRDQRLREHVHRSGIRYVTRHSQPKLSDTALARALASLTFCHARDTKRTLLTRADVRQYFPDLFRYGMPSGCYLDTSNKQPRFGYLRVDTMPSAISRIVSRTARLLDGCRKQSGFRELMSLNSFEICWLVPSRPKAIRLQLAFQALSSGGVRLRAAHVPVLFEVLAPAPSQPGVASTVNLQSSLNHSRPERV